MVLMALLQNIPFGTSILEVYSEGLAIEVNGANP